MSPFWTINAALARASAAETPPDKWFANGQSDIVHFFGAEADELYRTGVPSGNNIVGSIAGNTLTPTLTPLYQQALTQAAGDPLGVGFTALTSDGFSGDYHDYPGESWAILIPWRTTATLDDSWQGVVSRFNTSGYDGYEIQIQSTWDYQYYKLEAIVQGDGSMAAWNWTSTEVDDQTPHYLLFWHVTPNLSGYTTDFGESTDSTNVGTISVADHFKLGPIWANTAPACVFGPTIVWSGVNAETVITNRATNLLAWWAA